MPFVNTFISDIVIFLMVVAMIYWFAKAPREHFKIHLYFQNLTIMEKGVLVSFNLIKDASFLFFIFLLMYQRCLTDIRFEVKCKGSICTIHKVDNFFLKLCRFLSHALSIYCSIHYFINSIFVPNWIFGSCQNL